MSGRPTVIVGSWTDGVTVLSGAEVHKDFAGQSVSSLASDGAGGAYAVVGSRMLQAWSDGGWRAVAACEAPLSCCLKLGERLLAGTDEARILELSGDAWAPLAGFDATPGRERWYAGAAMIDGRLVGPPLGVRSMAASCDGRALMANVHVGGIPRSTDGGVTWRPTIDIDADVHQVIAHPDRPGIVAAAAAAGLAVSRDGGERWSITTENLHASYCSAVAFGGEWLYVAASSDHFADRGAVYRRRIDGEEPLERVRGGLPEWLGGIADTRCIAVKGEALAIVDRSGALYGSQDGGDSWSLWSRGLQVPTGVLIC